jgi:tRNA A-37 threonylcarbamoyl transferase component Bud32
LCWHIDFVNNRFRGSRNGAGAIVALRPETGLPSLRVKVCDVCGGRYKDKGGSQVCPFDGAVLRQLPDPLVGRTIAGRYVITAKIGGGGFGIVYRATHEVVGREVAIKFLIPDLAIDPTNRSRFLREAKAANRIDHEHIIDITDYGETDDGLVYLVMELLEGRALSEEIHKGPLGVRRAVDIAIQCASALARAHELDVVHRDIKPDNIFLIDHPSRRDFAKLLDFGLAQMKGELRLTATGAVFGTPEYMAPEQGRGAPLTGLADLYGLGCVLYEMVTGKLPFTGSTPDLILKHMRETAPLLSRAVPDVPPLLDETVKKLLEKDPKRRHRDAYHLLEDLRRVAEQLGPPRAASLPPAVSVAPASHPPGGRRRDVMMSLPPQGVGPRERETEMAPAAVSQPPPPTAALPAARGPASRVRLATGQMPPAWERKADLFRELVPRAHGPIPPPWLLPAIDGLATRIREARAVADELARIASGVNAREGEIRALRLRLGHAIDELGRDESRALGLIDDLYRRLGEAKGRHAHAEPALSHAIATIRSYKAAPVNLKEGTFGGTIPGGPGYSGGITHELAIAISDAGLHAATWLEAEGQVRSLSAEVATRERERDDVKFQLSQLKGRLGSLTAEQDIELNTLRSRTAELDRKSSELMEEVSQRAGVLTEHFSGFPQLREVIHAAGDPRLAETGLAESGPKLARR